MNLRRPRPVLTSQAGLQVTFTKPNTSTSLRCISPCLHVRPDLQLPANRAPMTLSIRLSRSRTNDVFPLEAQPEAMLPFNEAKPSISITSLDSYKWPACDPQGNSSITTLSPTLDRAGTGAGPHRRIYEGYVAKVGRSSQAAVGMPYGYDSQRSSRVWRSWDADNHGEVSSLVMKAYVVSLLLLASVLVWTMDDAWVHYGSPSLLNINGYSNFTVLDFAS